MILIVKNQSVTIDYDIGLGITVDHETTTDNLITDELGGITWATNETLINLIINNFSDIRVSSDGIMFEDSINSSIALLSRLSTSGYSVNKYGQQEIATENRSPNEGKWFDYILNVESIGENKLDIKAEQENPIYEDANSLHGYYYIRGGGYEIEPDATSSEIDYEDNLTLRMGFYDNNDPLTGNFSCICTYGWATARGQYAGVKDYSFISSSISDEIPETVTIGENTFDIYVRPLYKANNTVTTGFRVKIRLYLFNEKD